MPRPGKSGARSGREPEAVSATPTLSTAVADRVTVPLTVLPAAGPATQAGSGTAPAAPRQDVVVAQRAAVYEETGDPNQQALVLTFRRDGFQGDSATG